MKTFIIILLATLSLSTSSHAVDDKPSSDAVVVRVLDAPLPHDAKEQRKFLWDTFANKPEEQQFSSYGTDKWREHFADFAKVLVRKANDQKLNSESLRKALDLVLGLSKGKTAYLPVGAYQTTLDGNPVWIITLKWEYPRDGKESNLGHISMLAYDQKTLRLVGGNTCL